MNFKESFTYMFADKTFYKNYFILLALMIISNGYYLSITLNCSKIIIVLAALISIFTGIMSCGYMYLAIKNHNSAIEKVLPDFINNFKVILKTGAKSFVAVILSFLILFVPFIIICLLLAGLGILVKNGSSMFLGTLSVVILILFFLVGLAFLLFYIYWFISLLAMMVNFADTNSFFSFVNFKKSHKIIKSDVKNYAIIFLFYIALTILGCIICKICNVNNSVPNFLIYLVISSFTGSYFTFVFINLLGQFYKKYISLQQLDNEVKEEE